MKKNSVLAEKINEAEVIVLGAGAGLSAAGGLTYSGERFMRYFSDFHKKYAINDIYSGGFYHFPSEEEQWGWWCRHIYYNRYAPEPCPIYLQLFDLLCDKNYFVLTTNVDHQFIKAGFDTQRLFATQGNYGLFQCSVPCHQETFDNETIIKEMIAQQSGLEIPTALLPHCPHCGEMMTPHLRKDNLFVEDSAWHEASHRYQSFLTENQEKKVLFLELGVGFNTPGIIKIPFMQMTYQWKDAFFLSLNQELWEIPKEIKNKSLLLQGDLSAIVGH
ncbi:MAG: Sir2 silent information regulator family NAD-dependent deacetylase [Eubacteriales bacterium]